MLLSNFSVKRPVAMLVVIIVLMGLGLLALSRLRVNQIPDIEQPVLVVSIAYPGASPETVEREIVGRVEKALRSISGVDRSNATASEGLARLVLIFDFDKNMIEAAEEVRSAIGTVRHKLPSEMRDIPGGYAPSRLATSPLLARTDKRGKPDRSRRLPG